MADGKLPVDLKELHAGFSRAISKAHTKEKKKKHDVEAREYQYDVSPDEADKHLK